MKTKRKSLTMQVRRRVLSSPCVVCGVPYFLQVDHIIPLANGGSNDFENLQPLCDKCNNSKCNRLTNYDLVRVVELRGIDHFYKAEIRYAQRLRRVGISSIINEQEVRTKAHDRYMDFIKKWF